MQRRLGTVLVVLACLLAFPAAPPSHAATEAVTWPDLKLIEIADGFDRPVGLESPDDDTGRLFVVEQGGRIEIIEDGKLLPTPFLTISDQVATCGECGLLGLAFPPDFAQEGYFFVNYNSKVNLVPGEDDDDDANNDTVIARYRISDDPNVADPASEEKVLVINQPAGNHNGGQIVFGPDGYLYIGMGDGGGSNDTYKNGQNPASLLGKILRIEVSATSTYTIPSDNPFVDNSDYRAEIWATGLRNPWRFGFDRATGDLYIADVGQGALEEVNFVPAEEVGSGGMNFGWPIMEGDQCRGAQSCDRSDLTLPVATYDHDNNCSISGGFVFNSLKPNQAPVYLYGDYCSGNLWGLQRDGADFVSKLLIDTNLGISSFGEGEDGSIYLIDHSGTVYLLADNYAFNSFLPGLHKAARNVFIPRHQ